ncbi:MAG: glycosyltransferase family 2 protein [Nitrospirae bacterium]|nr:glycosyltransferase family 2 protein [Nitrospirota bacterium]
MPKVTVYIPTHNHEHYVEQAIESVLRQKFNDWELIVIDDGSNDNTRRILANYEHNPKIHIIFQENKGLTVTNNIALRASAGDYVMRLDGDDFLDENILLVLSNVLDTHPEIGLVYPDWYEVNEHGEMMNVIRRNNAGETSLFDIPAHGACTMIRKSCLLDLGGYNEDIKCQDGYDLWIRFIEKYKVYNVNCPLFYYRKHSANLTNDHKKIIDTRGRIKREYVRQKYEQMPLKVLGIIPVRGYSDSYLDSSLRELAGKKLIDYTIETALGTKLLDRVVLTTNDPQVLSYTDRYEALTKIQRPDELCKINSNIFGTLNFVLDELQREGYNPDAVAVLYINSPLRKSGHIEKAIDSMIIFDSDSVISVRESLSNYYQHHQTGMVPLFKERKLRLERDSLYAENGAVYLIKTECVRAQNYGEKVGHIIMLKEESIRIHDDFDFWMVEKIIERS